MRYVTAHCLRHYGHKNNAHQIAQISKLLQCRNIISYPLNNLPTQKSLVGEEFRSPVTDGYFEALEYIVLLKFVIGYGTCSCSVSYERQPIFFSSP